MERALTRASKMSYVLEGFGEEVIEFFVVLFLILVVITAWLSTNSRPRRYRTVFVMGRPARQHNIVPTNTPQPELADAPETTQVEEIIPLREVDVTMAAENRDIHYYSVDESSESEGTEDGEAESETENAQVQEMDSIVHAMEADEFRDCENLNRPRDKTLSISDLPLPYVDKKDHIFKYRDLQNEDGEINVNNSANSESPANSEPSPPDEATNYSSDKNKINIKLKYLNDSSKDAVGSLNELLKDFKLRYFSTELTAQYTVKIIFKGRLLADDSTLGECGVHDQAVLHCLVQPYRQRAQQQVVSEEPSRTVIQHEVLRDQNRERVWDLENVLMTLVSVALTVVWFLRCEYSSLFTASASVALFGLTVFYGVAIFGLYLSDTIQFNQRPRRRIPDY